MKQFTKQLIVLLTLLLSLVDANAQALNENERLNAKQERLVTITALTANGDLQKLSGALNTGSGLDAGLTINEIKEALVHLYAYCGFPRSIRGLQTFMEVLDARKANGINDQIGRFPKTAHS